MGATKNSHVEPNQLPSSAELEQADNVTVFGSDRKPVKFGAIRNAEAGRRLTLVFVRHWHCGLCQAYASTLAMEDALKDERIVVIGHGSADGIERYREVSELPPRIELYADPKRQLFSALGVTRRSLDMGQKAPAYQKGSTLSMVLHGVAESLGSGLLAFKGGDIAQLGAEFVFDAQGRPTYAHRMVHTRDHTEIPDLVRAIQA
ncbi:hypothetical protein V8E36_002368 [Tilletia maclaganii]